MHYILDSSYNYTIRNHSQAGSRCLDEYDEAVRRILQNLSQSRELGRKGRDNERITDSPSDFSRVPSAIDMYPDTGESGESYDVEQSYPYVSLGVGDSFTQVDYQSGHL